MWYFPETLRMMFLERIPTLSEEELDILVDIFLSIR
jgi:hypothetical protein